MVIRALPTRRIHLCGCVCVPLSDSSCRTKRWFCRVLLTPQSSKSRLGRKIEKDQHWNSPSIGPVHTDRRHFLNQRNVVVSTQTARAHRRCGPFFLALGVYITPPSFGRLLALCLSEKGTRENTTRRCRRERGWGTSQTQPRRYGARRHFRLTLPPRPSFLVLSTVDRFSFAYFLKVKPKQL